VWCDERSVDGAKQSQGVEPRGFQTRTQILWHGRGSAHRPRMEQELPGLRS